MTLHITEHRMTVDGLDIVARRCPGGRWIVTGCGPRVFTYNEAITALTLAEALASNPPPDSLLWLHIRSWKRELGYPIHPADGPHWPSGQTTAHDKGAAPIPPRTKAAPCHPATCQDHEVTSS